MADKPIALTEPPEGYGEWLAELKSRIHSAQQRATLAVNTELLRLYWQIGRDILARQAKQGWGARVIDRLSHDLRQAFPDVKGFSPRDLKYTRAFAQAWPDVAFVQGPLAQLPWYQHIALLDKLDTAERRRWYAEMAITHNWSRNVLVMQIEMHLLERQGQAVTNFAQALPAPQSDLAVAEYALRDNAKPLGIAECQLVRWLPDQLQTSLTTIEQIERELRGEVVR